MNKKNKLLLKNTKLKIESENICKYCGDYYPLFDLEKKLLDKHKFKYPECCPTCNFKSLNSLLNDKHLYHRKESKNGNNVISILSEYYEGEVLDVKDYKQKILDDGGLEYARDLTDDIFLEFIDFYKSFPKPSRLVYPELENSEFSSHVGRAKNVYLSYCVFVDCEDIYYSFRVIGGSKDIYNSFNVSNGSNVYSSSNVGNSSNIYYSNTIIDSGDLLYCEDMNNSKKCIFCCNQVNSNYKIFNKQYTEKEYLAIKEDIYKMLNDKKESKGLLDKYEKFLEDNLIKSSYDINRCEDVIGEKTYDSKNSMNVYYGFGLEDSVNVMTAGDTGKDRMVNIMNSIETGTNCENCVGSCSFGMNVYNIFFGFGVINHSKNIYYSFDIDGCEECMFCIGLKQKKYCILNKQYKKEEYFLIKEKLIDKLILDGNWGEHLPFELSLFPYNDTLAYDYFKVKKVIYFDGREEIIDKYSKGIVKVKTDDFISDASIDLGGREKINIKWRNGEKEINIPDNAELINSVDLPSIGGADESILSKVIICKETKRPYRIINKELKFLKNKNLPLPVYHNELRIDKLVGLRPNGELHPGVCEKCNEECLTVFQEKRKYKIYCLECYNNYMYK